MTELVFLKLGGSLITDKSLPFSPRFNKLAEIATELAAALKSQPGLSLVLGHGSGSFGHTAANQYHTRDGVGAGSPRHYWDGFAEVWFQASALNRFVMDELHSSEIPCLALAPVSALVADNGQVSAWNLTPLKTALAAGLVPVVYGDVVFANSIRSVSCWQALNRPSGPISQGASSALRPLPRLRLMRSKPMWVPPMPRM